MVGNINCQVGKGFFYVLLLKHWRNWESTKGWAFQEVQGYPGLGTVGGGGLEANYLAGGLKMRNIATFQIWQGGKNGKREDLTWLEGSVWIYMEIGAAQADVPDDALTLKGGVSIGHTGMILHR
jgi:hypothetical protein